MIEVDPPPTAFQTECLICQLVLREPYQTNCCGTSFCQTCIQQVQDNESSCSNCREENFQVFPNKGLKRSLNQLHVYCKHSKDGCTWSGELQALDEHINEEETQLVGCQFAEIQCEFHYVSCITIFGTIRWCKKPGDLADRYAQCVYCTEKAITVLCSPYP